MFKLLIDTSVWLDIVKDSKQQLLLTALERLVEQKRVELILPTLVIDEFSRNKARIIQDTTKSYAATLKRARELVVEFGSKRNLSQRNPGGGIVDSLRIRHSQPQRLQLARRRQPFAAP